MPKLPRKDGSLYYEIIPAGPEAASDATPFVVLPGISLSGRFYREFAEVLATHGKVLLPDHRRTGKSTVRLPWTYSIGDIAKDIIAIADHEAIQTLHVVGESYGGMIAMALAIDHRKRVESLCLINSSFAGSRYPRLKPKALLTTIAGMANPLRWYAGLEQHIFSSKTRRDHPEVIKKWFEIVLTEGMPLVTTQKQSAAALKFHPKRKLQKLSVPALVISGTDDQLVPGRNSHIIHKTIPHAKLHEVVGGGHHLCGEQPQVVAAVVIEFVKMIINKH
jgi:pimeloyl-ACP methyl ester carboxylesterase